VRGAVGTYMSESADAEEVAASVLSALARPEHREAVGELAQRMTGEAVRSLVFASAHAGEEGALLTPSRAPPAAASPAERERSRAALRFGEGPSDSPPEARTPPPAAAAAAPPARAAGPGWAASARLALQLAAQPEARALLRDVTAAAAGASVRALVTAVPSALYAALPELPFRRRAAAEEAPRRRRRHPACEPPRAPSPEQEFHDASPLPPQQSGCEDEGDSPQGGSWRGRASTQGALALAVVAHAALVSGMVASQQRAV